MTTNLIGLIGVAALIAVTLTDTAAAPSFRPRKSPRAKPKEPTR